MIEIETYRTTEEAVRPIRQKVGSNFSHDASEFTRKLKSRSAEYDSKIRHPTRDIHLLAVMRTASARVTDKIAKKQHSLPSCTNQNHAYISQMYAITARATQIRLLAADWTHRFSLAEPNLAKGNLKNRGRENS